MLTTKEARARVNDIVAEATLGINGFFNERCGRAWGIVGVALAMNGLGEMNDPLLIVAFFSFLASIISGTIAFCRGARGLGGTAITVGGIGFLLIFFIVFTEILMFFT